MTWDLGLQGLGVLALMSFAFGIIAVPTVGDARRRAVWCIAAGSFFIVGLLISEVWFGWATDEELQPNIDGLSFDEVLLGVVPAVALLFAVRHLLRQRHPSRGKHVAAGHQRSGVKDRRAT